MINKKHLSLCLLALLILNLSPVMAQAIEGNAQPLTCMSVPGITDEICYASTENALDTYKGVIFYRRTAQADLSLLGSYNGGATSFSDMGLSPAGRYLWLEWSEQGHPFFSFYSTESFLEDGLNASSIGFLSEHDFGELLSVDDDGVVSYTKELNVRDECQKRPCRFELNPSSPTATNQQDVYLCKSDKSVGFSNYDNIWKPFVSGITDEEFFIKTLLSAEELLQAKQSNNQASTYCVFIPGEPTAIAGCIKDEVIVCTSGVKGLKKIVFSPETGRYVESDMQGYWGTVEANGLSLDLTIGRCTRMITRSNQKHPHY